MRKLRYHLVDVFTDRAFGGNQLAVFTDARGLSAGIMQAIAKELNLSESTFVLPPEDSQNDYRIRIFTPAVELPMAGHPTGGPRRSFRFPRSIKCSSRKVKSICWTL